MKHITLTDVIIDRYTYLDEVVSRLKIYYTVFLCYHLSYYVFGLSKKCICRYKWPIQGMMTSSDGNIFRGTGPSWGEFTGHRWIPLKGLWRGALMFSLILARTNGWVNNREAGDLRRHRAHLWRHCNVMLSFLMVIFPVSCASNWYISWPSKVI